jgi:hypothetical protein
MIDRNMRMLASSGNRSTRSSTTSNTSSTRQQLQQKKMCLVSTVPPPIMFSTKQGVIVFKKMVAGVSLSKTTNSSFGIFSSQDASIMALHDLCKRGHPKMCDVVDAVEKNPASLEARNESGQYPLHVAVANAILPEVIMFLVLKFPRACAVVDVHGKCPLHYATLSTGWIVKGGGLFAQDTSTNGNGNGNNFVLHPEYMNMVQLICKAHSAALVHEDNDERNPIEYALLDDAPGDMISTLQRTSVQFQRARRAELKAKTLCNFHHAIAGTQTCAMNVQ